VQGFVLRGRFTGEQSPAVSSLQANGDELSLEWCERRLLARIHRLTLDGLRRQIQPVAPEQFLRFLARHQHFHPETRMRAPTGLLEVIAQLEGFEAPAGDWERHLLSNRVEGYEPGWLDLLTLTGQVVWGRLRPSRRAEDRARPMKALTRVLPLTLMLRDDVSWLLGDSEENGGRTLGSNAQAIYELLCQRGALFAGQLGPLMQMLPSQVEDALGELAAAGLVTGDGFAALRSLIADAASRRKQQRRGRVPSRTALRPLDSGRWSLLRVPNEFRLEATERTERWCRLLLRRYGVMFRDLLARESAAPPWHELVRGFRRLEARGDIRGGRFVAHVSGEQYALPEVIGSVRQDSNESNPPLLMLSATDPLNLWGRILPGLKVPAVLGNRLVAEGGQILAYRAGGEVHFLPVSLAEERRTLIERWLRRQVLASVPRIG
jgi:ATP-dependent Lhr-like helicase